MNDPALGLLSALGSFPAAFYYARLIGAAALRPVRDPRSGVIKGWRSDAGWSETLLRFLASAALVTALTAAVNGWFGDIASEHAAFSALLVATLWRHAPDRAIQVLLVLLLLGVGAARVMLGAHFPAGVVAGYAIGLCGAFTVGWILRGHAAGKAHG
jgi:hypothetical protein